jgi:ABC-2 type transport system ATP-binding protein
VLVAKPEYEVDLTKLVELIKNSGHAVSVIDGSAHVISPADWSATLNRLAFEAGITLASLTCVLPTLEETFFEMTGDSK